MASRTTPHLPQIINSAGATNMTGTAIVLSSIVDMLAADTTASLEIKITGTPTGTITVEGSNQYDPLNNPSATFVPLAAGAVSPALPAIAGAASNTICALTAQALGCRYFRVRYVNTSSTGVLNVWMHGRGV
jgi:hypothetical protein